MSASSDAYRDTEARGVEDEGADALLLLRRMRVYQRIRTQRTCSSELRTRSCNARPSPLRCLFADHDLLQLEQESSHVRALLPPLRQHVLISAQHARQLWFTLQ